jgi:hypothetical protein
MNEKRTLYFGRELSGYTGSKIDIVRLVQALSSVRKYCLLNGILSTGSDDYTVWPAYFRQSFVDKEARLVNGDGTLRILLYQDDVLARLKATMCWRDAVRNCGRGDTVVLASGFRIPQEGAEISHIGELDSVFTQAALKEEITSGRIEEILSPRSGLSRRRSQGHRRKRTSRTHGKEPPPKKQKEGKKRPFRIRGAHYILGQEGEIDFFD